MFPLDALQHNCDVIMGTMATQITSLTIFLLNRSFRRRSKKTPKLRVTGLCAGNSPVTSEFPAQMGSNLENVSIGWRHHGVIKVASNKASVFAATVKCFSQNLWKPRTYQLCLPIVTCTNGKSLYREYTQMIFLEWELRYFDEDFTKFCS